MFLNWILGGTKTNYKEYYCDIGDSWLTNDYNYIITIIYNKKLSYIILTIVIDNSINDTFLNHLDNYSILRIPSRDLKTLKRRCFGRAALTNFQNCQEGSALLRTSTLSERSRDMEIQMGKKTGLEMGVRFFPMHCLGVGAGGYLEISLNVVFQE